MKNTTKKIMSLIAALSVITSAMTYYPLSTDKTYVKAEEITDVNTEPSVKFEQPYASVGTQLRAVTENIESPEISWYVNNSSVGSGTNYTVKAEDLEKFIKAEVKSGGKVVAEKSVYCSELPVVYLECPERMMMENDRDHETYFDGTLKIQGNDEFSDEKNLYDGDISIKGRGTSSWWVSKKPYKIKLDSKSNIFGMGKNKHWVLLANYYDKTGIRNITANLMSQALGVCAMDSVMVDVVFNGEYAGNYQLCEQIRVGDKRVDIYNYESKAETIAEEICTAAGITDVETMKGMEDYLVENLSWITTGEFTYNGVTYDIANTFTGWDKLKERADAGGGFLLEMAVDANQELSGWSAKNVNLNCKAPEYAVTNEELFGKLKNKVTDFETALYNSDFNTRINGEKVAYSDLCNMDSLFGFWTAGVVLMNEMGHRSTYLYYDNDGILNFGPVWDFDWAMGNQIPGWPTLYPEAWFQQSNWAASWFYQVGRNGYFALKEQEFYLNNRDTIMSYIDGNNPDSFINKAFEKYYTANTANNKLWGNPSVESEQEIMCKWMNEHMDWLDKQFADEETVLNSLEVQRNSNLKLSLTDVSGKALEADNISIAPGYGKIETGKDIILTAKTNNSWEGNYMSIYVNNRFVATEKSNEGEVVYRIPYEYFTSEAGTKNVIQVYGKGSADSDYITCTNLLSVVTYGDSTVIPTKPTTVPTTIPTTTPTTKPTTEPTAAPTTIETKPLIGDVNNDGTINVADLVLLQQWVLEHDVEIKNSQLADINSDSRVNSIDIAVLRNRIISM